MDESPLFTALSTSARQLYLLLRCIAFAPKAEVHITPQGLRFSVEESRVIQGSTILEKGLFSSYNLRLRNGQDAVPPFQVNINALLETLQIFGIAESNSSGRHQHGGFSSSYASAFNTPALALGGTCHISYSQPGSPLSITIQEGSVTTTCNMNTYEPPAQYDDDGQIPLDRNALVMKIIMRSNWLSDAIAEISGTDPSVLLINASSVSSPFFVLEGHGGPFGDSTVNFTPEAKNEPTPSHARGRRQPIVTETFVIAPPTGSHGRIKQSYKFNLIQKAVKAMAAASKVSIRQDRQGVLSLQFMIDVNDAGSSTAANTSHASNGITSDGAGGGRVAFVDFRFVPLVAEDGDGEDEGEDSPGRRSSTSADD